MDLEEQLADGHSPMPEEYAQSSNTNDQGPNLHHHAHHEQEQQAHQPLGQQAYHERDQDQNVRLTQNEQDQQTNLEQDQQAQHLEHQQVYNTHDQEVNQQQDQHAHHPQDEQDQRVQLEEDQHAHRERDLQVNHEQEQQVQYSQDQNGHSEVTLSGNKRAGPDPETPAPPTPAAMAMVQLAPLQQVPTQQQFAAAATTSMANSSIGERIIIAVPNRQFRNSIECLRASKRDLNWDTQYEALVAFANTYGHCNVRTGYNTENEEREDRAQINLYAWLALQRRHRKGGRLRKDREEKLQLLVDQGKLTWAGADSKNEEEDLVQLPPAPPPAWNSYLGALLAHVEDYGNANVPVGHMAYIERRRNLDLGAWVKLQRQLAATGKLSDDQKDKLNALAEAGLFRWTTPSADSPVLPNSVSDTNWNLQFDAVKEHAAKYGDCNCTQLGTYLTTSFGTRFDLSLWVLCQRSRYLLRSLQPSRLERLHEMVQRGVFAWMSPEEAVARAEEKAKKQKEEDTLWNAWYNVLVWYGRHNGHCNLGATDTVSLPDESEAELGKWLDIQKRYLAKGKLKPDRVEKLRVLVDENKLPVEWIREYPQLNTLAYPSVHHPQGRIMQNQQPELALQTEMQSRPVETISPQKPMEETTV